jgi:pilus assembly protein TadC
LISVYLIFQKHKQTDRARIKIAKDILIFITTFLLIAFLGGLAGLFANFYVSNLFGAMVGFVCAMVASIVVGYFVKKFLANVISFN